ncbi:peroxiredoxin [Brucepastera parasyntrophica]|uniref:peroxiredoxin n=1 Tax=Brucepastera parasyntrophica TaxID=2880008 RepID=UPI00210BE0CF|nr:peroxiredoxin [Brucepastera parasyntrophica]ULQ59258.1 peroxiredoxin [Brucepastera parasyntrophica]
MLKIGDMAPDFILKNENNEEIQLSLLRGKKVVLNFYPKYDFHCSAMEACSVRDAYDDILKLGAVVIGISPASGTFHDKIILKYGLPFYMLADPEMTVIKQYESWTKKSVFGKIHDEIIRTTWIIDEEGRITHFFLQVSPKNHAKEILTALSA